MNRYSLVIIILSIAMALVSLWNRDWASLMVPTTGIVVVCAPMIVTGDKSQGYDVRLMRIAIAPLVVFIVLTIVDVYADFEYYYEVSIAVQAFAMMAFGVMIAVFLNARTDVSLPRRWVVLFAMTFAGSLSVLYTFSTIYWMYVTGYPIFNGDFSNTLDNDTVNMMLMIPMAVSSFTTVIYAVAFNEYLKRVGSLDLTRLSPGEGS
jgi:hypothetical protein